MSLEMTMRLVEAVGVTPAGSTVLIDGEATRGVDTAERWAAGSGNTVSAVHPERLRSATAAFPTTVPTNARAVPCPQ